MSRPALWLALLAVPACVRVAAERPPALTVRKGDFHSRVLLTGELKAIRATALVVPRLPDWQTSVRWMADDGSRVAAGDKVIEFDTSSFASQLEEKRLAETRAASDRKRQESDNAKLELEKRLEVERQRVELEKARIDAAVPLSTRSEREWQDAQLQRRRAETALAKADEDLASARRAGAAELEVKRIALDKASRERATAEEAIEAMVIRAPCAGVLLAGDHPWEGRKVQTGDMVFVGLTVAMLPDLNEMEVEAWLSDVDDGRIAAGMSAATSLDGSPESTYPGRVIEVAPVAEEAARQSLRRRFRVRVALDRPDPSRMLPGMSARVEVAAGEEKGVLLAPRAGLDLASEPPQARIGEGKTVAVKLGPCNALECVVREGLAEGAGLQPRPSGGRS